MSSSELLSCVLYHGPTAQGQAAAAASQWGRVVGTFGDPRDGLDVATIREAVSAMSAPPVGDRRGAVVVGPVDVLSQEGVIDILLKTLEEFNGRTARPYLWAWDAGSVRPTIRSRCLVEWCPGRIMLDRGVLEVAKTVIDASLAGSTAGVIEAFADLGKAGDEEGGSESVSRKDAWKETGAEFLQAVAFQMSRRTGTAHLSLWQKVRPLLLLHDTPSYGETLPRFLP